MPLFARMRTLSTQARLILFLALALLLLTVVLEVSQTLSERRALVEAERDRSLALASSVNSTIRALSPLQARLEDLAPDLAPRLEALVEQNEGLDFITVTWPSGAVLFHSGNASSGQTSADFSGLALDQTVRREVAGFGQVYLTSVRFENPTGEGPRQFYVTVATAAEAIDRQLWRGVVSSLLIGLGAMGVVGLLSVVLLRYSVSIPIRRVRDGARIFSTGNLEHRIPPAGSPELRDLTDTLNQMADALQQSRRELEALYQSMEARVDERTRDLQLSSEIGRIAVRQRDMSAVLRETVEQIRRRFDVIYHAQVFLLDDIGEYAVLVESSGEVGQKLLRLQHKLPVGSESVIGRVTSRGRTVIVSDTRKGEVPWQPNPLLPQTRAEMAVPLLIEGRVIGALDVQSTHPDVFTPDMIHVFEVLADQLAITIENARLLTESQRRVREIADLNRQLTGATWREFIHDELSASGYQYDLQQVTPLPDMPAWLPNRIEAPIQVRGETIGTLVTALPDDQPLTDDDRLLVEAVAGRVALAIENARLFHQAQQRAEEMSFLFNVTRAATLSSDLDESLRQAMQTLRQRLTMAQVTVFLADDQGGYLVKGGELGEDLGYLAPNTDHGLVDWVALYHEAVNIGDLTQDDRHLPIPSHARSAMAVPLTTAGKLAGVLVVESERPNAFDESDVRLLQTLSGSLAAIIRSSRLLREVQEANERLREVDRLKTNFLAAMSHELRTPLNSIIGFSRVILKGIDGPLTEMQEQDLNTIYDSGKHLLGLVNDILDQAKIEAGKMELSFGYFKLQEVIHGVMSTAVGLTRDKPIKLYTEVAENLPDAYGDEFRTRQILLNLVSNASKFTHKGSITVSAYPVEEDGRQFIQVNVADTGIGIAEKDMPALFEAFQQVDNSTTRTVEGTGLGLPLAKSLCELQGGRIWVNSTPGVGSTFSFTVPLAPVEKAEPPAEPAASATVESTLAAPVSAPLSRPVVLVIEDDAEVIQLYRRYLAREGYEVIGTTHPEQAEEMLIACRPAAVLLDVNMPNRDGWDVLESLKSSEDYGHIPVIMCSINGDSERGFRLGAADYLTKPFTEDRLLNAVRRVVAPSAVSVSGPNSEPDGGEY